MKETEYYAAPVAWAQKNGILSGYPNGMFGPNDGVTREQMALIIQKYLAFCGKDISVTDAGWQKLRSFSDSSEISSWAREGVAFCLEQGILTGMSNEIFSPGTKTTRGQFCVILTQLEEKIG